MNNWSGADLNGETELEAMQRRIAELQIQNEQLRSNSSRQHHQATQTQNMLLGQLANNSDPDEFDWNKVLGNAEPTPQAPTNSDGTIVVDRKKLGEYTSKVVQKTLQKEKEKERQAIDQGLQTQAQLQQRFVKEHPDLAKDPVAQETISRYWQRSLELNPNIPPEQRYQQCVGEAVHTMKQFGYKPGEKNQQQRPAYMGTSMSLAPGQRMQISREEQLGYEEYDAQKHYKEIKERHQATLDKFR